MTGSTQDSMDTSRQCQNKKYSLNSARIKSVHKSSKKTTNCMRQSRQELFKARDLSLRHLLNAQLSSKTIRRNIWSSFSICTAFGRRLENRVKNSGWLIWDSNFILIWSKIANLIVQTIGKESFYSITVKELKE
jgi:hypothetical protein